MNSKERVLTTLKKQEPDRVPVCEMFISRKVRDKICAGSTYFDFIEHVDIDVVTIPSGNEMKKIGENLYQDSWGIVYRDTGEWEYIETQFPISSKDDLYTSICSRISESSHFLNLTFPNLSNSRRNPCGSKERMLVEVLNFLITLSDQCLMGLRPSVGSQNFL